MENSINVRGARDHNLKNIDVEIPKNKLTVVSGVSGSGKSTLAFDTLYAEGQRRYVESLSSYARQFLGQMKKPEVDSIDGLSPAISIEQKTTSNNPRSTVGTVTEIYDYLRLLFARVGQPYCPKHNIKIERKSPTKITDEIISHFKNNEIEIFSPIVRDKKGTYKTLIDDLHKDGFVEAIVNGKRITTDQDIDLDRYKKHNIDVLVDLIDVESDNRDRIQEAIEIALDMGDGLVKVNDKLYSEKMSCPKCGFVFEELQPRMFSFNTPQGACTECHGIGYKDKADPDLVIPDKSKSILDGAIDVYNKRDLRWRSKQLKQVGNEYGFDLFTPIENFTEKQLDVLLYGSSKPIDAQWSTGAKMHMEDGFEGILAQTERIYYDTDSSYKKKKLKKYMTQKECPKCGGNRLKEKSLNVRINKKNIMQITDMSIDKASNFFEKITLDESEKKISGPILREIRSRLKFLNNVGLSYLTLSRSAGTLSGGESQRIRLATQLGSNLTGILYVLDEPSIGLHQRDNNMLIDTLHKLRDLGNTLIVVEHDEETIRKADHVIDLGPGAGRFGGEVTDFGKPEDIEKRAKSITGKYLSKELDIEYKNERRKPNGFFEVTKAKENNLKGVNVKFPKSVLTLITGVSGSGKSTLVHEIVYKALKKKLYRSRVNPGKHGELKSVDDFEKAIIIDQSPIGKTPRSNPATYTKTFGKIRELFAKTAEAKLRGYDKGRFSFNVKGGRCEKCHGKGEIKIEMNFLADIYITCDECEGKRFNRETLEVRFKGKNIAEVLDMSVDDAYDFFKKIPYLKRKLKLLKDVGLGYIKLGQKSTTLSGGEAQRIKLTRELSKRSNKNTIYVLDEPTTGLHFHDVKKLIKVINRLVDKGATVIIIEHNLDVIKNADWIIDLGPEGGEFGGEVIAEGTPEEVAKSDKSYTAKYLKGYLD
ncbi:MAG: excinuclease ABC subunit UvrA [Candidatus Woesearchaeota archaeon]